MSQVDNQKGAPGFMPEEMCAHIPMVKKCISTNLRRMYIIEVHIHIYIITESDLRRHSTVQRKNHHWQSVDIN